MIRTDVIVTNKIWFRYFKNPETYVKKKISKLNKANIRLFEKNIFSFCLNLSDDKQIKKLNSYFRKKNKTTDILSFPFYKDKNFKILKKKSKKIYIGDIIINIYKLKKKNRENFKEYLSNVKDKHQKYVLLGDMLELGAKSQILHESLSPIINHSKINKLFVHGLLHLFGYKHKKEKDFLRMNKFENQLFRIIN